MVASTMLTALLLQLWPGLLCYSIILYYTYIYVSAE